MVVMPDPGRCFLLLMEVLPPMTATSSGWILGRVYPSIVVIEQSLNGWKRKSPSWKFLQLIWILSLVQAIENHCFLSSEVQLVMWSPLYLKLLDVWWLTQALKQSLDSNPHRVWGNYFSTRALTKHVHWNKGIEMKQNQKDKYIELQWLKVVWEGCRTTAWSSKTFQNTDMITCRFFFSHWLLMYYL